MSYGDHFLLPGLLDNVPTGDEQSLHQGGLDYPGIRFDPPDIFPDDTELTPEDSHALAREALPQFGPPFVKYVHERFTKTDRLIAKLLAKWSYEPVTVVFFASMQADSSGNISDALNKNAILFEPSTGFTLALHRITIACSGNNFGSPFTVAAGYWELRNNGQMFDGGSLVSGSGSFPAVKTWGTRDAPRIRDGELLSLFVSGTNTFANKQVTVIGQGTFERHSES